MMWSTTKTSKKMTFIKGNLLYEYLLYANKFFNKRIIIKKIKVYDDTFSYSLSKICKTVYFLSLSFARYALLMIHMYYINQIKIAIVFLKEKTDRLKERIFYIFCDHYKDISFDFL